MGQVGVPIYLECPQCRQISQCQYVDGVPVVASVYRVHLQVAETSKDVQQWDEVLGGGHVSQVGANYKLHMAHFVRLQEGAGEQKR